MHGGEHSTDIHPFKAFKTSIDSAIPVPIICLVSDIASQERGQFFFFFISPNFRGEAQGSCGEIFYLNIVWSKDNKITFFNIHLFDFSKGAVNIIALKDIED